MRPGWLSATPLVAAVAWVVTLLVDSGPLEANATLLTGIGLLLLAALSVVGLVLVGGRWAHRLAQLTLGSTLLLAIIRPVDPLWWVSLALTTVGGVGIAHPRVTSRVRKLPSASGPPPAAVGLALVLTAAPLPIGLAVWDEGSVPALVVGLAGPLTALWFSRVLPGGLWAARMVWPALAASLMPLMPLPAALVSAAAAAIVAWLAWRPEVKTSYHPPREVGSSFPIPPELAPPEVLESARLDEKGRPK